MNFFPLHLSGFDDIVGILEHTLPFVLTVMQTILIRQTLFWKFSFASLAVFKLNRKD